MAAIKIAINGFGRIGRAAFKVAMQKESVEVVAVNDLTDNKTLAHLLKYDSLYGPYEQEVRADDKYLYVGPQKILSLSEPDPHKLPWKELSVDVALECTGVFTDPKKARAHLEAGAKKVIISAPPKGEGAKTFVLGVNEDKYQGEKLISNASCTTNCIAPIAAIISEKLGVKKAFMTTIHSYTPDQNLHDAPHRDLRRARAAAVNIVPTTTGAAISACETVPKLKGIFDGLAIRVPTPVVSLADFTFVVAKETTAEEVNQILKEAAQTERFKNILMVTEEPLVSSDLIGSPYSAIVDASLTKVIDKDLVKVVAWYDNEYGYSCRLVEEAIYIAQK